MRLAPEESGECVANFLINIPGEKKSSWECIFSHLLKKDENERKVTLKKG